MTLLAAEFRCDALGHTDPPSTSIESCGQRLLSVMLEAPKPMKTYKPALESTCLLIQKQHLSAFPRLH